MADSQALCTYPGINQIFSAHYALAHGITPGVISLEIAPQVTPPDDQGAVVFTQDDKPILTLPNCKLDSMSYDANDQGQMLRVNIMDRRWRWKFTSISGRYNIRDEAFNIIEGSETSPSALMSLCLDAMGEKGYFFGVDQVPLDPRPTVEWDYTNAAEALATLCDSLGCRVVLSSDNTVHICRNGVGAELPQTPDLLSYSAMPDPLERPDKIRIVGAPYRFQSDFPLEAVGKDVDGSIKPINQLTYRPDKDAGDGGWSKQPWPNAMKFPVGTSALVRQLAEETVYKWYKISPQGGFTFGVQDARIRDVSSSLWSLWKTISQTPNADLTSNADLRNFFMNDSWQLLLQDAQVDRYRDVNYDPQGNAVFVLRDRPAMVYGLWWDQSRSDNDRNGNSQEIFFYVQEENGIEVNEARREFDPFDRAVLNQLDSAATAAIVRRPFAIDRERHIVMFSEPVWQRTTKADNLGVQQAVCLAAQLVLRTGFSIKDPRNHQWVRFTEDFDLTPPATQRNAGKPSANGDKPKPTILDVARDEIVRRIRYYRTPGGRIDPDKTLDNYKQNDQWGTDGVVSDETKRQFEAVKAEYDNVVNPQSASYVGIKQIGLDGAIGLVTWEISAGGSTTTAQRNNDIHPFVMSYRERRFIEKNKEAAARAQRIEAAIRKFDQGGGVVPGGIIA